MWKIMERSSTNNNGLPPEGARRQLPNVSHMELGRHRMFVPGLGYGAKSSDLREYFEQFGAVLSAEAFPTQGYGYVSFVNAEPMKKVLAQHVHQLNGKQVKPKIAILKAQQDDPPDASPSLWDMRPPVTPRGFNPFGNSSFPNPNPRASVATGRRSLGSLAPDFQWDPCSPLPIPRATEASGSSRGSSAPDFNWTPDSSLQIHRVSVASVSTRGSSAPDFNWTPDSSLQIHRVSEAAVSSRGSSVPDFNWTPDASLPNQRALVASGSSRGSWAPDFNWTPDSSLPNQRASAAARRWSEASSETTDFNWTPPKREPVPPGELPYGVSSSFQWKPNSCPYDIKPHELSPAPEAPDEQPPLPLPRVRYISDYLDVDSPLPPPLPYTEHNQFAERHLAGARLRQRYYNHNFRLASSGSEDGGGPVRVSRSFARDQTHPYSR